MYKFRVQQKPMADAHKLQNLDFLQASALS